MNKETFNQTTKMLSDIFLEDFANLCAQYELTTYDVVEVLDDLALRGFKDKYNQHNHPENNPSEEDEDESYKRLKEFIIKLYDNYNLKYDETKDIYANYGSQIFGIPYEECLEWKDGEPYPKGKRRRQLIKRAICMQYEFFK